MSTWVAPHTGDDRARGQLRVYLGAAAGVGTTFALLDEGIRRAARGTSVMVGCLDTHGRRVTTDRLRELTGREVAPEELDVDQVLADRPEVVLVDELAHRNPRGAAREYRWQDVEVLLDAGISVVTTLSVQHIDSLADTVRAILGRIPEVLVPDEFLGRTDQIEIVDISPAAIRRRIAHGNVFGTRDAMPADTDLYSGAAFAELRALMMFWMADRLTAGVDDPRGAREKVVVAVDDRLTSDDVLRRAARLAHRSRATLIGVHVVTPNLDNDARDARRRRVEALGGTHHEIRGDDVATTLLTFAEAQGATQLVLGSSVTTRRSAAQRSVAGRILRSRRNIDVHIVAVERPNHRWSHLRPGRHVRPLRHDRGRRLVLATIGAVVGLAVLTALLVALRGDLSVATSLAIYLLAVVAITAAGGPQPGLIAAVIAPLLANWFLIPPYHTFRIASGENLLELLVFVSVASIVSWYVTVAARRALEAQRAEREASTLAALTATGIMEAPQVIIEQLRRAFDLSGVAVLAETDATPTLLASTGDAPTSVADADLVAPLASGFVVAARGPALSADDHRVLSAFLAELSRAFEQQRFRQIAAEADALTRADELRTAMLRAVSHDLRSPLASIKASVSSLRQTDVDWPADVRSDFLAAIEDDTDRLTTIVTNLLDLGRLEAGVLRPQLRTTTLEEVVPGALVSIGPRAERVVLELEAETPEVQADPALLERVVANLVDNALRWSPRGAVVIRALLRRPVVQLLVIDHGPGIPPSRRRSVLQPFNRLDDSATGGGLGLGLAIADRLVEAMGGELELRDTPGGGLTVVVSLPVSPA